MPTNNNSNNSSNNSDINSNVTNINQQELQQSTNTNSSSPSQKVAVVVLNKICSVNVEKVYEAAKPGFVSLSNDQFESNSSPDETPTIQKSKKKQSQQNQNQNQQNQNEWDWGSEEEDSFKEQKKKIVLQSKPSFEKSHYDLPTSQQWFKQCLSCVSWDLNCLALAQKETLILVKLMNGGKVNNQTIKLVPNHCEKG